MGYKGCEDCPDNCLGQEQSSSCVVYNGSANELGIVAGDSLDSVVQKICEAIAAKADAVTADTSMPTSDDIMSKSVVRNPSSVCSSNITKRDFDYTVDVDGSNITFSWNMIPIVDGLPEGYSYASSMVRVVGSSTVANNALVNSTTVASSVALKLPSFPVSVDFSMRVVSPCGQIDLTASSDIISPTSKTVRVVMDAEDINPQSGEIVLTDQLNGLESQVQSLGIKFDSLSGVDSTVTSQSAKIDEIDSSLSSAGDLMVKYEEKNVDKENDITTVVSDLYSKIKTLEDANLAKDTEIASLKSQINSLNAQL